MFVRTVPGTGIPIPSKSAVFCTYSSYHEGEIKVWCPDCGATIGLSRTLLGCPNLCAICSVCNVVHILASVSVRAPGEGWEVCVEDVADETTRTLAREKTDADPGGPTRRPQVFYRAFVSAIRRVVPGGALQWEDGTPLSEADLVGGQNTECYYATCCGPAFGRTDMALRCDWARAVVTQRIHLKYFHHGPVFVQFENGSIMQCFLEEGPFPRFFRGAREALPPPRHGLVLRCLLPHDQQTAPAGSEFDLHLNDGDLMWVVCSHCNCCIGPARQHGFNHSYCTKLMFECPACTVQMLFDVDGEPCPCGYYTGRTINSSDGRVILMDAASVFLPAKKN